MSRPDDLQHFDFIIRYLQQTGGVDISAYKRPSLVRRVQARMQMVGMTSFEKYLDYIQTCRGESAALVQSVLVNVTGFFRDPDVWHYMRNAALPRMLATGRPGKPFRVWNAGCASGQETYTVLMLLAELLGVHVLRDAVRIYATDVDVEALSEGRLATYSVRDVVGIPADLLAKYFDRSRTSYVLKHELRRLVTFARHDLLHDAPISRVDLLVCRNTLMYFNADAQQRVLARFLKALNPSGVVLLGRPELPLGHSTVFTPVDLDRRLFTVDRYHRDRGRFVPRPSASAA